MKETFQGGPGKVHPKQTRSSGLPSDCECVLCGSCIEHGSECYGVQRGHNNHGEFEALNDSRDVVCLECL